MDLSVIIAARNEEFLAKTVANVVENIEGCTEVIAVCDGYKPYPKIEEHKRVRIIYLPVAIGQRAAVNYGVRESKSKYIMKLDAHCAVDSGFDVKLMEDCQPDWTVVPTMYNLHAFDWVCDKCGKREYQGKTFECCGNVEKDILWKLRRRARSDFMLFDSNMQFGYWSAYRKRPEAKQDICDQLCAVGACWFMERKRYWEIDGLDENHGGWGQVGVEMACKSWLSGGKQVVNRTTWFAHMFRTGNFAGTGYDGKTFPYPLTGADVEKARRYSRDMWLNDKWDKAIYPLSWLIDRFAPVPGWEL